MSDLSDPPTPLKSPGGPPPSPGGPLTTSPGGPFGPLTGGPLLYAAPSGVPVRRVTYSASSYVHLHSSYVQYTCEYVPFDQEDEDWPLFASV